jgi:Rod binding domain-containing protein
MNVSAIPAAAPTTVAQRDAELRTTFQKAVAGTMFAQMLKSMRSTVGKPAYLHGGQAEDMFQSQLDQELVAQFSETNGSPYIEKLYRQFRVQLGLPPEDAVSPADSEDQSVAGHRSERTAPSPDPFPPKTGERGPSGQTRGEPSAAALSSQPSPSERLAGLTESVQQARMDAERTAGTTGTAALSALFRK